MVRISEQTKCRKVRLLRELRQLHSLRSDVLPGDLIFFIAPTPEDDHKIDSFVESHGPSFVQNWINTNRPLFLQSQRAASQTAAKGSRLITQFFNYIRAPIHQAASALRHRGTGARPYLARRGTGERPFFAPKRKKPPDPPRGPLLPSFFTR
jgi:hypothetical protein